MIKRLIRSIYNLILPRSILRCLNFVLHLEHSVYIRAPSSTDASISFKRWQFNIFHMTVTRLIEYAVRLLMYGIEVFVSTPVDGR